MRRPDGIEHPGPGQVSVWDFPRPPRVEPEPRTVRIVLAGHLIAETSSAMRVLETSHPPTIYLPATAFRAGALRDARGTSYCEFKGVARYHDLVAGSRHSEHAGWSYPRPPAPYADLEGHVAVYPSRVDEAWLGGERVVAQPGDFYGGWITRELVGPFKGGPGTRGW
ncbi:MAG: DUF427 domain-containing protein [Patulibacter minatonensis]